MTTNKLPPLPERAKTDYENLRMLVDFAYEQGFHEMGCDPLDSLVEALRQSQSLPAGAVAVAVAGLVGKWRDRTNYADTGDEVDTLNYCADELEQALQADAREKGEAVSAEDHRTAAAIDAALTGTGFLVDGQHVAPSRVEMIRVPVPFATEPAQASEKVVGWLTHEADGQISYNIDTRAVAGRLQKGSYALAAIATSSQEKE